MSAGLRHRPSTQLHAGEQSNTVQTAEDRKSTRLNSSHSQISYAVFCLKKKKTKQTTSSTPRTSSASSLRPQQSSAQCTTTRYFPPVPLPHISSRPSRFRSRDPCPPHL